MNKLYIYGVIGEGDLTAKAVQAKLSKMGNVKEINVHINSGGGSVTDGIAIFSLLKNHKAKINVHIDSLAASIASVIATAGDHVTLAFNGLVMIHDASVIIQGSEKELTKMASTLKKITSTIRQSYMSRDLKVSEEELVEMMKAETWLNSSEALELGFVDSIAQAKEVSASITKEQLRAFNNVPELLSEEDEQEEEQVEEKEEDTTEAMFAEINKKLDMIIENTKKEEEPEVEEEESQEDETEATNNNWLF